MKILKSVILSFFFFQSVMASAMTFYCGYEKNSAGRQYPYHIPADYIIKLNLSDNKASGSLARGTPRVPIMSNFQEAQCSSEENRGICSYDFPRQNSASIELLFSYNISDQVYRLTFMYGGLPPDDAVFHLEDYYECNKLGGKSLSALDASSMAIQVSTIQEAPFSCKNAYDAAHENLNRQCAEKRLKLVSYQFDKCVASGGDGAYVNYFSVSAKGICDFM